MSENNGEGNTPIATESIQSPEGLNQKLEEIVKMPVEQQDVEMGKLADQENKLSDAGKLDPTQQETPAKAEQQAVTTPIQQEVATGTGTYTVGPDGFVVSNRSTPENQKGGDKRYEQR